jgi:hypothetical protein
MKSRMPPLLAILWLGKNKKHTTNVTIHHNHLPLGGLPCGSRLLKTFRLSEK